MRTQVVRSSSLAAGLGAVALVLGPALGQAGGQDAPLHPDPATASVELAVREVVVDRARDGIMWSSLRTSHDGHRIAYMTRKGPGLAGVGLQLLMMGKSGKGRMVVDGQESPEYIAMGLAKFSPDGRRVAYWARSGSTVLDSLGRRLGREQERIVLDSVEQPAYDNVGEPVFSPNGQRLAYGAQRDNKIVIVLDGVEGAPHEWSSRPVFSPDGTRVAYIARDGEMSRLLDGATEMPVPHQATWISRSPDGQRLSFLVEKKKPKKWSVVVDGQEGPDYDDVEPVVFSPDSRRYAHVARRGKKALVVIDGVEGGTWDHVGGPVFSPDSATVAYAARQGKAALVVVEGGPERTPARYRAVGQPVFSPDGKRLAYLARIDKHEHAVVDGVPGPAFDAVSVLTFSPDGRHLAYEARRADRWRLVVDGVVGPEYGRVADVLEHELRQAFPGWTFSAPDQLWYVGGRDDSIVRWEVTIGRPTPPAP